MTLSLAFSPCPNDTFIFDALIHHKIDTEGLQFEVTLHDVEELNNMAFAKKPHISKLSYHAYGYISEDYILLNAGSALGQNCGPLLIAKQALAPSQIPHAHIAIPGKYTTANLLLSLAHPHATRKVPMLFSDIEDAVLREEVDAGLIIHENRFTYQDKGLHKIQDLGEFWESITHQPIPLGGIAIKRSIPIPIQQKVDRLLKASIRYAMQHPQQSLPYITSHAQEIDPTVIQQHIQLYVNQYSLNLGTQGRAAIHKLYLLAAQRINMKITTLPLFVAQ